MRKSAEPLNVWSIALRCQAWGQVVGSIKGWSARMASVRIRAEKVRILFTLFS
jgi:hypothetical protein